MLMQNYKFIETQYITISMIIAATYIVTILIDKKINIMPIIGLLLCIELLINYTFTFKELEDDEAKINTYMSSYAEFKNPVKEIIDNDKEFYRMEKTSNFYLNDSIMLNYKGISHSSSTFDKNVSDLLKKIGYSYYMDWPSYGRGNTIITDMLFNIKYKISNYEDEEYFKNERTYGKHHLLKNEKHLPLGFISDGYIKQLEEQLKYCLHHCTLTSSSIPAKVPISASTVTFLKCAYSTTFLVSATFSSYGLLDISIITDVYPASIHSLAISKLAPWSK